MKLRLLLTLSLILCCAGSVLSYNLKYVRGLSNSSVLSIAQRPSGEMLFGTCDGLNSYDGNGMWLTAQNTGVVLYGHLVEDVKTVGGSMWVLTNYGLNIMSPTGSKVDYYGQFKGLRKIRCNPSGDGFLLHNGHLWFLNKKGRFQSVSLGSIRQNEVCDFSLSDGRLYVFLHDRIVRYVVRKTDSGYAVGRGETIASMTIKMATADDDVEYLVDQDNRLYAFRLATERLDRYLSLQHETDTHGSITDVLRFRNYLFVSFSERSVIRLSLDDVFNGSDSSNRQVVDLGIETGVFCMQKDRNGEIVWIGTDGQGVGMYSDEPYSFYTITLSKLRAMRDCPIRALLYDREGTLWVGTKGNGLLAIPHFSVFTLPSTLSQNVRYFGVQNSQLGSNIVYHLTESRHPWVWICNAEGISYYSYTTRQVKHLALPDHVKHVIAACEDGDQLWMATLGFGICRADISEKDGQPLLTNLKTYVLDGGKQSSNYFFSLAKDNRGQWWFGNRGKGLYTLEHNTLKSYPRMQDTADPSINDVYTLLPVGDDLWVGSGMGISILHQDGSIKRITMADGLPNNTIHALACRGGEEVWASSNNGLVALTTDGHVKMVVNENALSDIMEYSDGAVYVVGNRLFFGGVGGGVIIDYNNQIKLSKVNHQLEFTRLYLMGVRQNISQFLRQRKGRLVLTLNYDQNYFNVGVATYNYLEEPMIHYYYKLSERDEWIDNGRNSEFSFTNMSPGHYTLFVKTQNINTGEEMSLGTLHIVITPPWYRTWWAYVLYLLAFVGLAYVLFNRWRNDQRERQAMEIARLNEQHREAIYEEKMKFLTNVVHELNTPLTLIYGPCERIMDRLGSYTFVRKYVSMIMQNLGRLNMLIHEIIDFRRITTGHHEISIRRVNMSAVVGDYTASFVEMASRNHIVYEQQIEPGVVWNSDETALRSIVSNLISNAFKYTKREGTIKVTFRRDGEHLLFSVYNTGQGIKPEDQQRIFDYYSVFDSVDESSSGGQTTRNGLGMAICHKMVELLGGSISIDSEVGHYACFNVVLPQRTLPAGAEHEPIVTAQTATSQEYDVAAQDENAAAHRPRPQYKFAGDQAPTLLVIDDNQDLLNLLTESLQNCRLLTANDAEKGLEMLKNETPDLIITDLMMPGMDGLEFTQRVKHNKHTMHIPLIILSAKTAVDERIEGFESGADMYITKPFSISYLISVIKRLLENRSILKEYYNSAASVYSYSAGTLVSKDDAQFVQEMTKIVDEHMSNSDLTPDTLATLMGLSRRSLYRKFESAQLPPAKEFIREYRINAAARLLTTTRMTISEVMFKTGFDSRSLFYSEFRKHFNTTPKAYRESYQTKDESL